MKVFIFFLMLFFPFFAFAQDNRKDFGTITGTILTSDGQVAPYVSVLIKNTGQGTTTNDKGNFEIRKIRPGTYVLSISLSGYSDSTINVEVKQNEKIFLKLQLQKTWAELQKVIVESSLHTKYIETKPSESLRLNLPLIEIPQNIEVTTKQIMADQGQLSMTEAIRTVSGIQKTYGGLNDYSLNIRGTDATWNVFRNGVGGYWWNQQEDIAMLEKIEFIKGPAGFMISMAEPGGIVNNVTKQPVKESLANINAGFGSYNMMRITTDLGGSFNKNGKISYRFNAGIHNQERAFQFSKASRYFVCTAVKYEPNERTSITAEFNRIQGKTSGNNDGLPSVNGKIFALPLNFALANASTDWLIAIDNYYRIQLKYNFNDDWHLTAQVAYIHGRQNGHRLFSQDIPVSNDTFYRAADNDYSRSFSGTAQAFVDGKFYTSSKIEHQVLLGFDYCNKGITETSSGTWGEKKFGLYLPKPQYYINPDSLKNFDIDQPFQYYTKWAAIYIQDHIKIAEKLVATLAGHFTYSTDSSIDYGQSDKNKTAYFIFTPRAGLTWLFSDNISIYALYDQCFLPQYGIIFQPIPIKPLTGYNMETGIKSYFFRKKLELNFSIYHIVKNNTLTQDPVNIGYEIEKGQITSNGIDFDITGNITPALIVNANYEYADAKVTRDNDPNNIGIPNLGTPKHYGNLWLKYKFQNCKLEGISFAVGYQYMGKRSAVWYYDPNPNTRFLPVYSLLDAALSYNNEKFNISLNVYNITNINFVTQGYFTQSNEWRYTPGEPLNFRLSFGVNLIHHKKTQ